MSLLMLGLLLVFLYLTAMVVLTQYKKDTSIANFTWGGGVLLIALYSFIVGSTFLFRQWLLLFMLTAWSSRLFVHVYRRYTGTDPRFSGWHWQGYKALLMSCAWVYGQFFLIIIMAEPALLINSWQVPGITRFDIIGFLIWVAGYVYEAVSDHQLYQFMQDPANKGRVLRTGLWQYSRHPNYFGESLMWWGIFVIALSVPNGWTAIMAPLTMTFLLVFVTGIPLLERAMKDNPEYAEYMRTTSAFIPRIK